MNLKKIFSTLSLFLLVLGLQACSQSPDETINSNVKAKIAADNSVASQKIDVSTKEGVVTLSGTVDNASQVQTATNLAQSVAGVKRVDTQLTVKGTQSTMPSANNPAVEQPGYTAPAPATTQPMPAQPAPTQPAQPNTGTQTQ